MIDHAVHVKTVFCDIDGCIFKHHGDIVEILTSLCELLPGVRKAFKVWCDKGYTVILTTGRPESLRDMTVKQIHDHGLYYHSLIMNLPLGQRVVINDVKPGRDMDAAACVNLERNKGMGNVDI